MSRLPCSNCGDTFRRSTNTKFCSTSCRFIYKLTVDDCWTWDGSSTRDGYGSFYRDRRLVAAHRASYELFVGGIPDGLQLDHLCRNRACVNPDHLEPVTAGENVRRGESPSAVYLRKGRCMRGHEFNEVNTRITRTGRRQCRPCAAAYQREARRKEMAA